MRRFIDLLINSLAVLSGLLLCTLAGLICIDVGVRNLRWFSLRWTLDIAEYHLYVITFWAAPWVLREQGHIAVDLLVQQLNPRMAASMARFSYAIGALVSLVLLVYAIKVLWASYAAGTMIYKSLIMPEWPLFLVPPLTFFLMLAVFVDWWISPPEKLLQAEADGF